MAIARRHDLKVVEDAAQGVMASYKGRALGSIGDLGAFSFHETKNVISGEGGALLVNDPELALRAEIIREKGTDRSRFLRGEVDKYTWQELGSSFLPGELIAAFLWAQIEEADRITQERLTSWQRYHELLEAPESRGILRRPIVPDGCRHNAHVYYVLLAPEIDRQKVWMSSNAMTSGLFSITCRCTLLLPVNVMDGHMGSLAVTIDQSERLIRLPIWIGLTEQQQDKVVDVLKTAVNLKLDKKLSGLMGPL